MRSRQKKQIPFMKTRICTLIIIITIVVIIFIAFNQPQLKHQQQQYQPQPTTTNFNNQSPTTNNHQPTSNNIHQPQYNHITHHNTKHPQLQSESNLVTSHRWYKYLPTLHLLITNNNPKLITHTFNISGTYNQSMNLWSPTTNNDQY